jgi:peroxiredoxin
MARVELDATAPEFELPDWSGDTVRLSDYRDKKHVVLVFNRGFI